MQALHCKLDVVLVQILRYNCSETDYSFCPLPRCGFHPQTPSAPHYFFRSAAPVLVGPMPLTGAYGPMNDYRYDVIAAVDACWLCVI